MVVSKAGPSSGIGVHLEHPGNHGGLPGPGRVVVGRGGDWSAALRAACVDCCGKRVEDFMLRDAPVVKPSDTLDTVLKAFPDQAQLSRPSRKAAGSLG